jgi:hypothetical protein
MEPKRQKIAAPVDLELLVPFEIWTIHKLADEISRAT